MINITKDYHKMKKLNIEKNYVKKYYKKNILINKKILFGINKTHFIIM